MLAARSMPGGSASDRLNGGPSSTSSGLEPSPDVGRSEPQLEPSLSPALVSNPSPGWRMQPNAGQTEPTLSLALGSNVLEPSPHLAESGSNSADSSPASVKPSPNVIGASPGRVEPSPNLA